MKILDITTFINEKLNISPISKTRLSDIKENGIIPFSLVKCEWYK